MYFYVSVYVILSQCMSVCVCMSVYLHVCVCQIGHDGNRIVAVLLKYTSVVGMVSMDRFWLLRSQLDKDTRELNRNHREKHTGNDASKMLRNMFSNNSQQDSHQEQ